MARILIAEDERVVARDIQGKLEPLGYEVAGVVASGEQAIETAAESRPDLIIMDIRLKGEVDGVEAAERIRTELDIPIVYLTAYADDDTLERAKVTQPFGYIVKPFEQRDLRTTVEIALFTHAAERRLRESEAHYRTLVQQSLEGILIGQGWPPRVIFANPAMEEISGYTADELMSRPAGELEALVHSEDRELFFSRYHDRLLGKPAPPRYEFRGVRRDGQVRWLVVSSTRIEWQGQPALQATFVDVTERRRTEEELRVAEREKATILDSMTEHVVRQDTEHRVLWVNRAAADSVGASPEELVGRYCYEIWQGRSTPCPACPVAEAMRTGESRQGEMTTPEGRVWLVRGSPVRDLGGEICGAVETTLEVTSRRKAEQELRYRADFERLVAAVSSAFVNVPLEAIDAEIHNTLRLLGEFTDVDRSYVFQFYDNGSKMDNTHEWCVEGVLPHIDRLKGVPTAMFRWSLAKMRKGEALQIPCVADLPAEASLERQEFEAEGIRSLIMVPMLCAGDVTGFLGLDSVRAERTWPEDSVALLKLVGEVFANALGRRRSEHALRESEERYRTLVESVQEGVGVNDADGNIVFVNPVLCQILGYTRDELLRMRLEDLAAPGHRQRLLDETAKRRDGVSGRYEMAVRRKDGELRTVSVSGAPWTDEEGRFRGTIGVILDVTAQRRAQDALREGEAKYRELVDQSLQGVLVIQDHRAVFANQAVADLSGYTVEELLSLPPEKVKDIVHPEDQELVWGRFRDRLAGKDVPRQYEYRGLRKDGTVIWLQMLATRVEYGGRPAVQGAIVDITERKRTEEALRETEQRYRELFENSRDGFVFVDVEGRFMDANRAYCQMLGYSLDELKQKADFYEITPRRWHDWEREEIWEKRLLREGYSDVYEKEYIRKDGTVFPVELRSYAVFDEEGKPQHLWGIARDITERAQTHAALRASEEKYRSLTENLNVGVYRNTAGPKGRFIEANPAIVSMFGYRGKDEFLRLSVADLYQDPDERKLVSDRLSRQGFVTGEELQLVRKDGTPFWGAVSAVAVRDEKGEVKYFDGIIEDVTQRRLSESALRESEERFRQVAETVGEWIWEVDDKGLYTYASRSVEKILGYQPDEIVGRKRFFDLFHPDDREELTRQALDAFSEKRSFREFLNRNLRKDGETVWLSTSGVPVLDAQGNLVGYRGADTDITERKWADEALRESEERYRLLFEQNLAAVYRTTLDGRVVTCNESFARLLGYESRGDVVRRNAGEFYFDAEDRNAFLAKLRRHGSLTNEEGRLRHKDGTEVWTVENVSLITPESSGEPFIQGTMVEITERKKAEQELSESHRSLERLLEATVSVLASTVELRDPYTAGHQRGVARLACAIAEGMGLSEHDIAGIRIAALIHDVGKIQVPAEILSKPGRLTDTQFGLIRVHPRTGHDVVSAIDFPWPVAEIVLQHHERLDGSGYPGGLKGPDILQEARILAVADVVEAMTSHRPYRAAFSVDQALEEVTRNRGVLYDEDVADTCVRLFRNGDFAFLDRSPEGGAK